jgi:hypothetical protein
MIAEPGTWRGASRRWGSTIEARYRVGVEVAALHEEGAQARKRGLPDAHGAERQVGGGHAIHPRLDRRRLRRRLEVAHARRPASATSDEGHVLPEVPSVGFHPSFRLATLLRWNVQNCSTRSMSGWAMLPVLRPEPRPRFRRGQVSGGTRHPSRSPVVGTGGGVVVRDCSRELQLGGEAGTRSSGPKTCSGRHGGCLEREARTLSQQPFAMVGPGEMADELA